MQTKHNYAASEMQQLNDSSLKSITEAEREGQFELVSAGLVNYLPGIDVQQHRAIYTELLKQQQLSKKEQNDLQAAALIGAEGGWENLKVYLRERPVVICTFHTGSYRILNLFLLLHGIAFTLVTGREVMQREGNELKEIYRKHFCGKQADGLRMINAEEGNAGLRMLRELRAGRSLMLYMDGNTGAGNATSRNENHCVVNFLNGQVYARKGIGYLAYKAGVPLLPVYCYRTEGYTLRLRFDELIYPDRNSDANQFAEQVTQKIYRTAGEIISQYPEQWEGWLQLHKTAVVKEQPESEPAWKEEDGYPLFVLLNKKRYGVFTEGGSFYLLGKNNYTFFELDCLLYRQLKRCGGEVLASSQFEPGQLEYLLGKGVLTAASR